MEGSFCDGAGARLSFGLAKRAKLRRLRPIAATREGKLRGNGEALRLISDGTRALRGKVAREGAAIVATSTAAIRALEPNLRMAGRHAASLIGRRTGFGPGRAGGLVLLAAAVFGAGGVFGASVAWLVDTGTHQEERSGPPILAGEDLTAFVVAPDFASEEGEAEAMPPAAPTPPPLPRWQRHAVAAPEPDGRPMMTVRFW